MGTFAHNRTNKRMKGERIRCDMRWTAAYISLMHLHKSCTLHLQVWVGFWGCRLWVGVWALYMGG